MAIECLILFQWCTYEDNTKPVKCRYYFDCDKRRKPNPIWRLFASLGWAPKIPAEPQDFGTSAQHHPPQPCPVLIIAVCDDRDYGIFCNVSQALERNAGNALRLVVDGDVERGFEDRKADGYHMRNRAPIGSGKMSDALVRQEPTLVI
jgi:hypothetical protein